MQGNVEGYADHRTLIGALKNSSKDRKAPPMRPATLAIFIWTRWFADWARRLVCKDAEYCKHVSRSIVLCVTLLHFVSLCQDNSWNTPTAARPAGPAALTRGELLKCVVWRWAQGNSKGFPQAIPWRNCWHRRHGAGLCLHCNTMSCNGLWRMEETYIQVVHRLILEGNRENSTRGATTGTAPTFARANQRQILRLHQFADASAGRGAPEWVAV